MEYPRTEHESHTTPIQGVNFAEMPPLFKQPVVLFLKDRDNPAAPLDVMQHLIPEMIGLTLDYDGHALTLDTPFGDTLGGYLVDEYIVVTGVELEELIRISSECASSSEPYLRANAVMMSGVARQLGLDADAGRIAAECLGWVATHDDIIEPQEMLAIVYAYVTTMQVSAIEDIIREQLQQATPIESILRHGSITDAYLTATVGDDVSAAERLMALSDLLKKT